ncbi:MAG: autotransporter domain-containing protein [Alphaproteobacteria bacterium]|nr:autotransporter domain-containing protein [Alphaproteobacteria bacterium]
MNNNVGFVLQGIPPVNASLTLHLLNTEIKNGQVAQWGAGFYDSGKFSVEAGYGHNQIFENVTFTNNRVTGANSISYGGALYIKGGNEYYYDHQPVKTQIISSGDKRTVFNQNYVSNNNVSYFAFGGGLYNCNSELSLLDADFTGNYTKSAYMAASEDQFGSAGGAVINHLTASKNSGYWWYYGRGIINQINGTYTGNYSTWVDESKPVFAGGGAIFNTATIGDIGTAEKKAVFIGNYAKGNAQNASHVAAIGGAIANYGDPNTLWQQDPSSSSGYNKYQGGTSGLGMIGNIYADFTDNYAQSVHSASQGARGGALANVKRNPLIGNITGNFTNNQVLTATNGGTGKVVASGGAISNEGIIGNITGDFRENKAYNAGNSIAVGGAIYNTYALGYKFENNTLSKIGGIINSNFYDNVAESTNGYALGGAIFTAEDLMIKADNGTSVFHGNKTISKSALADKEEKDEAIYVNKTSSTPSPLLELEAVNGGTLTFYDSIDGSSGYRAHLTGDANSHINLYNDIKSAFITADSTNISTADGNIKEYSMYNLVADNTAKWTIDFSVEGEEADAFGTTTQTETAGKVVLIDHFNLKDKAFNEITNKNFKVQILKTQGTTEAANLQLALTAQAAGELGGEFVVTQEKNTTKEAVTENTNWSHDFRETGTSDTTYGTLGLATTDTYNDSIGLTTRNESTDYDESLGDTLMLVNTADLAKRNFNADQATYKVRDGNDDIGTTHAGELNINGQGKNVSTLDGNGAKLFDLSETGTTVSLNNVKVTNAATVATLSASDDKLNLNNAEISGNNGEITANDGTIEAVNINFYDNSGTEAGAIASGSTVKIIADNGTSEIRGNTAGQAASADTAIYMKSNPTTATTPVLNIEAKNNGVFTLRDSVDGDEAYAANITGDATGTVRLYNDVKKADVSVDTVNMELNDGTVKDYSVNTLTSDASAKWSVDVDVENKTADRFVTTVATPQSGSVVTLNHFEQKNGNLQDVRDENFKVQILKTQGTTDAANLQLALSDDAKAELGDEFILEHRKTGEEDSVTTDTKWSRKLYRYTQEYTKYGQLGLATTDTLNDSIGMNTRETDVDSKESLGDTLKLVNQAELDNKNFIADTADEVYTLEDDLGKTYGNLTIKGVADGEQKSTIDLNGHGNFDVPEDTSLTLVDVVLKGDAPLGVDGTADFNNAVVEGEVDNNGTLTAKDSKLTTLVNGSDAALSGGSVNNIVNSGAVSLKNTEFTSIDGNNGVVNMLSDVDLSNKKVSNNKVVLQGVKATATSSSFGKNVDLVAESGSEVNVNNNKINVRNATFGKGSQLTLNVDDLQTFGGIRADAFDIANGAKLDITFGQNPLDGKKTGEVALLSLSDGSDINNNNFTDVFHNNMYGFARKSEKSGIYEVYQTKTAREVSQENEGTQTNQDTAGAWVDGPSHGNPTAQGIAGDLARLAQTDGAEFNKALTALAPNDDGMAQAALIDLTDRLLLTVDNHLIRSFREEGLSSGDGYPDLSNVKAWIKTYYAESKMQNHGNVYGYDADDRGFIAGVDRKITSSAKVGLGVQYDDTNVDAFQRDVNIKTLQGYVYGEYRPSNWFANGVLSYGTADYDEDKHVIGHNIAAHYKANIYSVQGLTGYTFKYFTPELGARYYKIKRHGYVDEAMQNVSGNDMDLLRTTLGIKAEIVYGRFKPSAYVGAMYDVISDKDSSTVGLSNGEYYTVNGKRIPRFGVEIGVGTTVMLTDHLEIGAGYEAKFRKRYQDHSGWMNFKYVF